MVQPGLSITLVSVERCIPLSSIMMQADDQRIFAAVKESCERLQTDYVDVFQVRPIAVEGS